MVTLQFPFEPDEGFIQSFLFFPTLTVGIPKSASKEGHDFRKAQVATRFLLFGRKIGKDYS